MKILTLAGTRPELIRLSIIIKKLDKLVDHVFVYSNQNYDYNLSTKFFEDLDIRLPNYYFQKVESTPTEFIAKASVEFEKVLLKERPDKVLILGDTNTGLLAMVANRVGIPVYHMEAGNRCYDEKVPEEVNRRIIDSVSKVNLPYTEGSKQNLLNEGFSKNRVFKTGNPIAEVLNSFYDKIYKSSIMGNLGLERDDFVLLTTHRAENVCCPKRLTNILLAVKEISKSYKVVFPVHPKTKSVLDNTKLFDGSIISDSNILFIEPLGLFDFVKLENNAIVSITDSGTNSEESAIYNRKSLIIRDSTERQELIECGASILAGTNTHSICDAFDVLLRRGNNVEVPQDYKVSNVSDIVISILTGVHL